MAGVLACCHVDDDPAVWHDSDEFDDPVCSDCCTYCNKEKEPVIDDRMTRLLAAIREHSGMDDDQIREAGEHGADAGWPGFTYTNEAAGFTRDNAELVYELLGEDAEEFGYDSIPAFVATFARADMADSRDGYDNLLAWYALERAGRYLAEEG